jgi:hypothetical protein
LSGAEEAATVTFSRPLSQTASTVR